MVEIKVNFELANDFYNMVSELKLFMSLNMVQLDSYGKTPEAKKKLKELVKYSVDTSKILDIFKEPFSNNSKYNIEIVSKNLNNLLMWIHRYLSYAGSILKDSYPDMYNKRYSQILNMYIDFRGKYKIN